MKQTAENINDIRSQATKLRLTEATIEALVEVGFSKTTGVEVCRRAELTRGALNHHYPIFTDLLVTTLGHLYEQLLAEPNDGTQASMEGLVEQMYAKVTQREFGAVIELWMAAKNETSPQSQLGLAIAKGSELFSPERLMRPVRSADPSAFQAIYRTVFEAMIGIGLGRTISNGAAMAHENQVVETLKSLARSYDKKTHAIETGA